MTNPPLYVPETEHDACGVAFVADAKGRASHQLVVDALAVLARLAHRGAVGADPETGDGAGILLPIPHALFASEELGFALPDRGDYAVAMCFLPLDPWSHPACVSSIGATLAKRGLRVLGKRTVPVDPAPLGQLARETQPHVVQIFVHRDERTPHEFERECYLARRAIEEDGRGALAAPDNRAQRGEPFYVCSFSAKTIVYKGLLLPDRLARFYRDLGDPRLVAKLAVVHQRFSTNTFPTWERAHPYRLLAHNGEINTLRGNVAAMRAREGALADHPFGRAVLETGSVLAKAGSDSAMLDNALELLVRGGCELPRALATLIPEAWENVASDGAFYQYAASFIEPWDGPACVVASDGDVVCATLDRNGLRPARYLVTDDDLVVLASESGVYDVPPEHVRELGRLGPGQMLVVDTRDGTIRGDAEVKARLAAERSYGELVEQRRAVLPRSARLEGRGSETSIETRMRAFGYTREDRDVLLTAMAAGKEPIGSMGNDIPIAPLSSRPQLLSSYFKQLFAQVTNPPIDPLREARVMSLRTTVGPRPNLLSLCDPRGEPETMREIELASPILDDESLAAIRRLALPELRTASIDTTFAPESELERALDRVAQRAVTLVREGHTILVLSDRATSETFAPIPPLLSLAAAREALLAAGLAHRASLIVDSGEPRETMCCALLLGYGAAAVCPYLALEIVEGAPEYARSLERGLLKVMSKMGISTLASYRGAGLFEALGLDRALVERFFPGTVSRLSGVGLDVIASEQLERHRDAYARPVALGTAVAEAGVFRYRRDGEPHELDPKTIAALQHAVRTGKDELYRKYESAVNAPERLHHNLRGLVRFKQREAIPLSEVEPATSIVRRFRTGAMSFGSISKEAHETIAIAMNRIGGRSNSGEGGEDPARFAVDPETGDSKSSAVKQIASGRFGVTIGYLVAAEELQIKIAQGAKPGEGGQLPGFKVDEAIARTRFAVPGTELISPPPHHDIYSIEDLAQLVHDLRCANPHARISVKLVSEVGVGTVAAGVAKAGADAILISGHAGGTGASPLGSILHAGLPWELGLAEAQQVLVMNDLRGRVRLEVDGQLKTGRDVVVAALLGAEEFGFGTAALVASGCILMRQCHANTCPVGIATQDPVLRARFAGEPEHVITFMRFIAEDVRRHMAALGCHTFDELVGRAEWLEPRDDLREGKARSIDVRPLLFSSAVRASRRFERAADPPSMSALEARIDDVLSRAAGEPCVIDAPIGNEDRAIGTRLSSRIARTGETAAIRIRLTGHAGQSLGAFLAPGVDIELEGTANDSVAKGMSGGRVTVRPPAGTRSANAVLVGNVALYGATGGELFVAGRAGERFAVRNSGAIAVVEGVGDHGCEYMTRGVVVVLGSVGHNFAAGMSGGVAYVLGDEVARINRGMVEVAPLDSIPDAEAAEIELRQLIRAHYEATQSALAWRVLAGWAFWSTRFVRAIPRAQAASKVNETPRTRLAVMG